MTRRSKSQSGQTSVMLTLGLTATFGMVGLVTDFGYAYYRKEAAQAAAQAVATATVRDAMSQSGGVCGNSNVVCQSETTCPATISGFGSNNIEKGCLYAIANGFTSTGRQKVTIETGTGTHNGVAVTYWAVVKVSEDLPTLFSIVSGNTKMSLTARSSVGYVPVSSGGCVYVLAPTGAALTTNGNTGLSSGCGVQVNSSDTNAINLSGGNTTITVSGTTNGTANSVNVVGNFDCYGQTRTCISPTPNTGAISVDDPMNGIDTPTDPGGCSESVPSHGYGNQQHPTQFHNLQTVNVICGVISPGNNDYVQFEPGTYLFRSPGGISLNNGNISGTGVTFYFPTGSSVSMSGNGVIDLHAPTSGTYQGVLMFQDRLNTATAAITGNSGSRVEGVLYFPNAVLHMGGNGSSVNNSGTTSIVAYNLVLDGNSTYIQGPSTSPYLTTYTGYAVIE